MSPTERLATPHWRAHDDAVSQAGLWEMAKGLPAAVRVVLRLAWRASPVALGTAFALELVSGGLAACGLLATANALTTLLAAGPTPERLAAALPVIALVVAVYGARGLADAGVSAATARLSPSVRRVAEDALVEASSHVELAAFDESDFHDAMERARDRGVLNVHGATDRMVTMVGAVISLVAAAGALAVLHPLLLPVLLLSVVPEAWAALRVARLAYDLVRRTIELNRRLWMISDLMVDRDPAAEVRAFTAQSFLLAEYRRLATALESQQIRLGLRQARVRVTGRALSGLGTGAAYATLGWLLFAGLTPLAVAGTAVLAIRTGRSSLTQVVLAVNRLYEQGLYIADYRAFLDSAAERTRPVTGRRAPRDPELIEVRDVEFGYPGAERPALTGVSMTVRRGEVVALVGENGSGKSTLAKVLAGLYLPAAGRVAWDGVDLAAVDGDSVADRVGVVMQTPTHWPLTVRENVRLGRPTRVDPDGRVLAGVARDSGVDAVVAELPLGWDTLLSKKFREGRDLSGGQWQRISVGRALYRDAPLIICDEPTAALDARAEAAVYDSLRRLGQGRTVVLITHRLASVRQADQIVVLHQGRIVERGDHEHLMALGGHYAEMYSLQARAYQDERPTMADGADREDGGGGLHRESIVDIHLVLRRSDGSVLLTRPARAGAEDGMWQLPSTQLVLGESEIDRVVQAVREEIGVEVDPADLEFRHVTHHQSGARDGRLVFFFHATRWRGEPAFRRPDRCAELGWFPVHDLPANTVDYPARVLRHRDRELPFDVCSPRTPTEVGETRTRVDGGRTT
ncbi:ATP-binding cassette domain-containing protein [Streptoalloteichus hindustanus]|uniref:ATP-binding cassette domain-containing protein n=1 Tax=Streptoalloteichus hindustanus TaxID=2017 RepID=UPI000937F66B|nr:ATP-binding cassette domain-containing protein [Streptoalloteichus hindustanus]